MDAYLRSSDVIDWRHPGVLAQARALAAGSADAHTVAQRCFEWVRDTVRHSIDFALTPVPCAASDVLRDGSGYCYAKSHLLAALLRANGIPAGVSYQRLALDDDGERFCLHGLNAVRLPGVGWYRIDARGNRPGVDAQFVPPVERLAFEATRPGELAPPCVWAEPLPVVVDALRAFDDARVLADHLPDLAPDALAAHHGAMPLRPSRQASRRAG